ncbi:heavy metal-associated isoprenylated plant protein 9-like isoform X1 [Punica granatum]|uniref:Heavy metal-associated isoprenylated plant protein 9-like isoform X1 n=1 Tax=Punica granatum TaxID=22663 RepID=A0A6P8CAV6_PUNGR|nr:heavy metal-associated isoprenylated plant protein 9-like isoform X1 [Punica granatum]
MGEGGGEGKAAKQDEAKLGKVAAEEKKAAEDQEKKNEEKAEDDENKKGKEEKAEEEPKPPTPPPAPLILHVDLHCVGCVKKIKTFLLKTRGVEEVEVDMEQNQVKIKGVVSPQSLCDKISKKTKRRANVIHPLPSAEGDPLPELVISQVSGLATVELSVYVHCEGCAKQLQRKILKMRGVQTVATEASSGRVTVTGTMDPNELARYVYRRTKKQAQIIPQPEPVPKPEPEKKEEGKGAGEQPEEIKKGSDEDGNDKEEKKEEGDHKGGLDGKEGKEERSEEDHQKDGPKQEESSLGCNNDEGKILIINNDYDYNYDEEEIMKRLRFNYPQPIYIIERIPPQPFSDENLNSYCCIS